MPQRKLCNKCICVTDFLYTHSGLVKSLIIIFFNLFLFDSNCFSQENSFRRHFIIAYDVSSPFVKAQKSNPSFRQALIDLFTNKNKIGNEETNQPNLLIEQNNKVQFFDPQQDEISFFHFNIAFSEFGALRSTDGRSSKEIIEMFNNIFLKDKMATWSDFKKQNGLDIENYISSLFKINIIPPAFEKHVSASNFVYPLVLDKIDKDKYAKEYILILLSDFLSGSMQGNKQDYNRIKEVYGFSALVEPPANSPPFLIKRFTDELAARYYKTDFFDFSFSGNPKPAIIGYKIKPKAGFLTPEDISVFVDEDIDIRQRSYQSKQFKISSTKIKFTHNPNLKPVEVSLRIVLHKKEKEAVLFDQVIAKQNENNDWVSNYTSNSKLMAFDSAKYQYYIPPLIISFDSLVRKKDIEYLQISYQFSTNYSPLNANPLNYIYTAERQLPGSNISFTTRTKTLIMLYGIPAVILLAGILFIIAYGRPRKLHLHINGYLDSYQVIDYKKVGKLLTPYKYWDIPLDKLPVHGRVLYKSTKSPFNWKSNIRISLSNVTIPEGFDIFLKENTGAIKEFSPGHEMILKKNKNDHFDFFVCIRQNDISVNLSYPVLVKFSIIAVIQDNILFFKSEVRTTLEYLCHLGPDLGDVWVGLDPGTTGSCISTGSHGVNIFLANDKTTGKPIISSKLVFDKRATYSSSDTEIPNTIYRTGELAETVFNLTTQWQGFQSMKKLLGFKNHKIIQFQNGNSLSLSGKSLSGLLIKGLYNDLQKSIKVELPAHKEYLDKKNEFNPLRAVVAIPNNFTISKIQDIIDCCGHLNQFKEVRYVYEAEAVLFYYLSNFKKFNPKEGPMEKETILVFDMGGATINTTVVDASIRQINNRPVYFIDFLSKIGYGIGGDTIDYCIAKFLLQFSDEFLELKAFDIKSDASKLAGLAFTIKKEIVRNYELGFDYLITHDELQRQVNSYLGTNISVTRDSNLYSYFLKNERNSFPLFSSEFFQKYIYRNIEDAVNEVIHLSDHPVNKVIFSGRSTFFPGVKETVIGQFEKNKKYPRYIMPTFEESKTAVAQGACWYGINKNAVRLNNLKTNAAFGVKRTRSADKTDAEFIELVQMGCAFDDYSDEVGAFSGQQKINDDFAFDGAKINFYQVMGKNADQILSENQKHKFSKIAGIQLPLAATEIGIKVKEDDNIECAVKLVSDHILMEKGVVSDQDMEDANEEHYTWTV
jgi:hypothetical protein